MCKNIFETTDCNGSISRFDKILQSNTRLHTSIWSFRLKCCSLIELKKCTCHSKSALICTLLLTLGNIYFERSYISSCWHKLIFTFCMCPAKPLFVIAERLRGAEKGTALHHRLIKPGGNRFLWGCLLCAAHQYDYQQQGLRQLMWKRENNSAGAICLLVCF